MFKRILIANRGEIAIRVINAAKALNIQTVAIYHEVDKNSLHTQSADFAYEVKGSTPKDAYLDISQILEIADISKSEAIHPGYGFLSENAKFSQACDLAGIKFIGPKPKAIELMGNKTKAREIMQNANVPVVPGTKDRIEDIKAAKTIAKEIGYPILLKAAAGGGGKGMRLVENENDFEDSFNAASREALKAFGDDTVYMEKYILNPKHIEIQVIADSHGNYVHLAERDCSIQRRHQKVIEEAPSTILDDELRNKMGEVAINAAKAVDYVNAGTIEFLVDIDKNFYFLEMNTRLQVEHPVSEIITNIDLAKEQIRVAAGLPLSFKQKDIKIQGHALEVRIYAEDALNNFMPDIGKIRYMRNPSGPGVRIDTGIEWGDEVGLHFDPMLSKLITWGKDRNEAIDRMIAALSSYEIIGFKTIIPFLKSVINDNKFRNEYFDTGFLDKNYDFSSLKEEKENKELLAVAISAFAYNNDRNKKIISKRNTKLKNWKVNRLNSYRNWLWK